MSADSAYPRPRPAPTAPEAARPEAAGRLDQRSAATPAGERSATSTRRGGTEAGGRRSGHALVAEPAAAALWLGLFLIAGGAYTLCLAVTVPGHSGEGAMSATMHVLGVGLVALGAACARWGARRPRWLLALGGPLPVLLIAAANLATDDTTVGSQLFLLLPVLYAASFLGGRLNLLVLVEAVVAEALVMAVLAPPSEALAATVGLATTFALTTGTILTFRRRMDGALAALASQAAEDPLTGLANRRAFDDGLARAVASAARTEAPLSLMLVDVDRFKAINDADGHPEGDRTLRLVAESVLASVRAADTAARLGGDEFGVLLPGCSAEEAEEVAGAVARRVAERTAAAGRPVTLSTGVATLPDAARSGEELFAAADAALYRAKRLGRARVASAAASPEPAGRA
ncbi:GGDEF domain-containing protein [Miltoncostaea marina]|uniref:GGDEF domain-containing protein n=1 Tax=Miltoncostaea marina TaxID=2843215 RepID=UPI001C3CB2DE|nr:GGDEF domain-containing protein [Miltoncostaea marina]